MNSHCTLSFCVATPKLRIHGSGLNERSTTPDSSRASASHLGASRCAGTRVVRAGCRRLDRQTVVFQVGPDDGLGLALEWSEPSDEGFRAFKRGPRYAAGYRRGPQAWDLDHDETPEEIKRLAERACVALSQSLEDTRIREPEDALTSLPSTQTVQFAKDAVTHWLANRLKVGEEMTQGWRLQEVYPHGLAELAIAFEHDQHSFTPRLKLRLRDDDSQPPFELGGWTSPTHSPTASWTMVVVLSTRLWLPSLA